MAPSTIPELRVELRDAAGIFDDRNPSEFPHTGRPVHAELASYLERRVREMRNAPSIELTFSLEGAALDPASEERARHDVRTYFHEEGELAELDIRVNRTEGWGSLRYGLPLIVAALAIAGVFYLNLPGLETTSLLALVTTLVYLFFITVVWVSLWDPIEKLLFDAYLLRARCRALAKLANARIRFVYPPSSAKGPSPVG
jgi:hypothetical protein